MIATQIELVTAGWHTSHGISVKGRAYVDGTALSAEELCIAAQTIIEEEEFYSFVSKLNGFFAIIIKKEEKVFASVDLIRSIPLFYAEIDDVLYLSDSATIIQERVGPRETPGLLRKEFMLTGYVTGSDTLDPRIMQLQSGEALFRQHAQDLHTRRYFTFLPTFRTDNRKASLREQLDNVLSAAVERLVKWAAGRTIVIPLSGGYDSRILAVLLKQMGHRNIHTYTYGIAASPEVEIARKVADSLNLECHFVEYTNEAWWRWYHSTERQAYFRAAHNLSSIPHIQDWPAVWSLKKNELIPSDAIIAPGHSGDFVAGSHIPKEFCDLKEVSKDSFISQIFDHHYTLWKSPTHDQELLDDLRKRIETISGYGASDPCSFQHAIDRYEAWDWQERQAKFIVNSVRVYDFWGYDWWLPHFDSEVAQFWLTVPHEWRINCRLYIEYVIEKYAKIANLSERIAAQRAPILRPDKLTLKTAPYLAARSLYHLFTTDQTRKSKRPMVSYDRNRLAVFGMMDRSTFEKYRNEFKNYHSFVSKAILEGDYF